METESGIMTGNWLWGALWVFYAYVYAIYFGHVRDRFKPDSKFVNLPGSPERLSAKRVWCFRFAGFMVIPTFLEAIRPSLFTSATISLLPCVFGLWVMHAIWREVMRSQMPKSALIKQEHKGL